MAKNFSFDFTRGDTISVNFGVTDENGEALNLTSADEIYFTMKKNYKTSDVTLQKKYSTGALTYTNGEIVVNFSHNDTKNLKYGTYVYDIEVSLNNGEFVDTTWLGEIELTEEATW